MLQADYDSGDSAIVNSESITFEGYNADKLGTQTINVKVGDVKVAEYNVKVTNVGSCRVGSLLTAASGTIIVGNKAFDGDLANTVTAKSGFTTYENNGIRFASGSAAGSLTLSFGEASVTSIVFETASYGSDNVTSFLVSSKSVNIGSSEVIFDEPVSEITIASTAKAKRFYLYSMIVATTNTEPAWAAVEQVNAYIDYFMVKTNNSICTDTEEMSSIWDTLKTEYDALDSSCQDLVKENVELMTRYEMIINGNLSAKRADFMNVNPAQTLSVINRTASSSSTVLVVFLVLIGVFASVLAVLLVTKKSKRRR